MKNSCLSRKNVYIFSVSATFPYLVLLILVIRGCTLPGAKEGLLYFFKPKWSDLLKAKVWIKAAQQNFNSIGIAFGSLIAMSSYNDFHNNIIRYEHTYTIH